MSASNLLKLCSVQLAPRKVKFSCTTCVTQFQSTNLAITTDCQSKASNSIRSQKSFSLATRKSLRSSIALMAHSSPILNQNHTSTMLKFVKMAMASSLLRLNKKKLGHISYQRWEVHQSGVRSWRT